jgi:8-oxo-dGTP diphosphatase
MAEPQAAVAIVEAREPVKSILFIRRSEREGDPWSGHWSFPGGWRDQKDPDLLHTALRELEEECGIRLGPERLEAALPPKPARRRTGPLVMVAPFLFRVESEQPAELNPQEAVEALWTPRSTLLDPARHLLQPVPGLPREMLFPAIDLNGVPLWGFTYRVITDWLGLGPSSQPLEKAGFEAAGLVLNFLLSHGLTLQHEWADEAAQERPAGTVPAKAAAIQGVIPVSAVIAYFSGRHVPAVNMLEVRPDYIRVVGAAFEEYFIYASR